MEDKKITVLLALVLVLAVLAGKIIIDERKSGRQNTETSTITNTEVASLHEEYPDLPENNALAREPMSDTIKRFESGTGIIFLGFKECPWCQKLVPLINEAATAEKTTVYYLDIKNARANTTPEYLRLATILSPYVRKDDNGQPRISVPDVSFVRKGEIVWRYEMEQAGADATPESYWTDERKERAIAKFREQIQKLYSEDVNQRLEREQ